MAQPDKAPPCAIVFDCDGVLLASNRLKTAIFQGVLREAGFAEADITRFATFQRANFGMSRYRLFDALQAWPDLMQRPDTCRETLCATYGQALYGRYVRCRSTPGMLGVVRTLHAAGTPLFVVSGSEGAELQEVFRERGLAPWFRAICQPSGERLMMQNYSKSGVLAPMFQTNPLGAAPHRPVLRRSSTMATGSLSGSDLQM